MSRERYNRGNPTVIISPKKYYPMEFYENMFIDMLLRSDRYDVLVNGMGSKIRDSVEVVCRVAKKTEGTFLLRYGQIEITEKEMEDYRRKAMIQIPCRNLRSETNGYHKVRNLNSDPWDTDRSCYNQDSSGTILYLFRLLSNGGHGCLIGHDDNIISCVRHFISTTNKAQNVTIENVEIELGYTEDTSLHPGIKIEMDVEKS